MQIKWNDTYIHGTKVSLTNPELVLNIIKNYSYQHQNYISLFGLYPLAQSFEDRFLQKVLNQSYLNPLHGKSIEFYLKKKNRNIKTVDGVFLLKKLLNEPLTHYFYGTNEDTLNKIKNRIEKNYSNAMVCGYKAPPFLNNDQIKDNSLLQNDFLEINKLKPNIVWIGFGGIKQDLIMYHYVNYLDSSLLIGVGAVFDYFAGNLKLSSEGTKSIGFRWLQRLINQPYLIRKKIKIMKILLNKFFEK